MENKLILVKHDMFKEETIKSFNPELFNYIQIVGDELPQYEGTEYTFITSFSNHTCMDTYKAYFDLFTRSNPSGDHIFLKLEYFRVDGLSPQMDKLNSSKDNIIIIRINNTNTTIKPYSKDEQLDDRGGLNVTLLYDLSRELLKEIANAKQLYIKVPLMKSLDDIKTDTFLRDWRTPEENEKEWTEIQEKYTKECHDFQLMCRLFYTAVIDESAYPGLVEKEVDVLSKTKDSKDNAFAEFKVKYEEEKRQKEIAKHQEKKKKDLKDKAEIIAIIGYPIALVVGAIWGLFVASWTPLISLLCVVTAILVIMAIVRNI